MRAFTFATVRNGVYCRREKERHTWAWGSLLLVWIGKSFSRQERRKLDQNWTEIVTESFVVSYSNYPPTYWRSEIIIFLATGKEKHSAVDHNPAPPFNYKFATEQQLGERGDVDNVLTRWLFSE